MAVNRPVDLWVGSWVKSIVQLRTPSPPRQQGGLGCRWDELKPLITELKGSGKLQLCDRNQSILAYCIPT